MILLGGFGASDDLHFGGTQYAKVILEIDVGPSARARYGLRKARSSSHPRDRGRGAGRIRARFERRRIGCGAGGVKLRSRTGVGASIEIPAGARAEFQLFHEGPSRILLSTSQPENVLAIAQKNSVEAVRIGVTMKERLRIDCDSKTLIDCDLTELRQPWETSLEGDVAPINDASMNQPPTPTPPMTNCTRSVACSRSTDIRKHLT